MYVHTYLGGMNGNVKPIMSSYDLSIALYEMRRRECVSIIMYVYGNAAFFTEDVVMYIVIMGGTNMTTGHLFRDIYWEKEKA